MRRIILILSISFFTLSCEKEEKAMNYPNCLQTYINTFQNDNPSPRSPKSTIKKYIYNDKEVFVLDFLPNAPDSGAIVVSSNCEVICYLGGIDGNQNDCVNWNDARFIETVWTDNR